MTESKRKSSDLWMDAEFIESERDRINGFTLRDIQRKIAAVKKTQSDHAGHEHGGCGPAARAPRAKWRTSEPYAAENFPRCIENLASANRSRGPSPARSKAGAMSTRAELLVGISHRTAGLCGSFNMPTSSPKGGNGSEDGKRSEGKGRVQPDALWEGSCADFFRKPRTYNITASHRGIYTERRTSGSVEYTMARDTDRPGSHGPVHGSGRGLGSVDLLHRCSESMARQTPTLVRLIPISAAGRGRG